MTSATTRELLAKSLKRRAELDAEREALDRIIEIYQRQVHASGPVRARDDEQMDLYRGAGRRSLQAARIADLLDEARRIMIAEKRPMRRGELVRRLAQEGYELDGADKNKVFGTNLWRSGRFRTVEGRGYWPLDVELPNESRGG